MSGRHGGRESPHAGTRDFVPESPVNTIIRTMGRHGARENAAPNLALDGDCEWVTIRYGVWQGLEVGKTYTINGRKAKVVDKKENSGQNGSKSNTGLPRVCVEWKS